MTITFTKVYLMPIVVIIWFLVSFLITYTIAVVRKSIPALWPYISDTGTFAPESCIFGQLLNMGAILYAIVIYLRYRHVATVLATQTEINVKKLNIAALILGFLSSFGMGVVANFQETNVLSAHILGANLAFVLGTIYQLLQSIMSWKLLPLIGSKWVNILRIFLTCGCTLSVIIMGGFAGTSRNKFDGDDITKWTAEHGGYVHHLISTISEWILTIMTMVFVATFSNEFKHIKVVEPEVLLISKLKAEV